LLPRGSRHGTCAGQVGEPRAGVKRLYARKNLVPAQFARSRHVHEHVEMVAHDAIRQDLDAREIRHAAHALDEPRALILVQVKGAVGHPAYQVVAHVRLEIPPPSHGVQYTKDSVTPPLLLVE